MATTPKPGPPRHARRAPTRAPTSTAARPPSPGAAAYAVPVPTATAGLHTYYIDFEAGSDANDGATKQTPWKLAPTMAGWQGGGKYVHAVGDRFIFKGGVAWKAPDAFIHMDP